MSSGPSGGGFSSGDPLGGGDPPRDDADVPATPAREEQASGWLPPAGDAPATDPTGRPWAPPVESAAPVPVPAGGGATTPAPAPAPGGGGYSPWDGSQAPTSGGWAAPGGAAGTPAGYGSRVQAAVVDFFVRLVIVLIPVTLGAILFVASTEAGVAGVILGAIVGFIAALAYAPVMIARRGQTVGHKASGTRIVRKDGSALTGGQAALREIAVKAILVEIIGGSFVIPWIVNYLWPLWDDNNEALHDKIASTRVVEA